MKTEVLLFERQRATQALEESERRYARLLASTSDYIYSVKIEDGRTVATEHGPGCEAVTGFTSNEFAADPYLWYRVIHEEDRAAVLAHVNSIFTNQTPPPLEHRIIHRNGEVRWIQNTCIPHHSHAGRLLGYDGLITNITSRKQAELLHLVQYRIARILSESDNLTAAIPSVLEALCQVMLWHYAAFWKLEQPSGRIVVCGDYLRLPFETPNGRQQRIRFPNRTSAFAQSSLLREEPVWFAGRPQTDTTDLVNNSELAELSGCCCALKLQAEHRITGIIELRRREMLGNHEQFTQGLGGVAAQLTRFIDRENLRERLEQEHSLLRTLVNHLPDCVFIKDTSTRFVLVNPAHQRILGVSAAEDAVGKRDADYFPPELATRYEADDNKILQDGEQQLDREGPILDSSGMTRWFLTNKVPLKDATGQVTGLIGIGRDITERRRRLQSLRESRERLALVIESSKAGIWDWNIVAGTAYYSPRWKTMLGYCVREIEATFAGWIELLHPEDRERVLHTIDLCLQGKTQRLHVQQRLKHKDGSYRWISTVGITLFNPSGSAIRMTGSNLDITESKSAAARLEEVNVKLARKGAILKRIISKLKASNRELEAVQLHLIQAARFESVGTLAAGVAHEVKNPLQMILLGLDYITEKANPCDHDLAMTLQDMRESVNRANSIVQELLSLSALTRFECTPCSFNQIVERSLLLVHNRLVAAHISVKFQLGADIPPVPMDANRMEQVFVNLLINALQAMPQGGALSIRTFKIQFEKESVSPGLITPRFNKGDALAVLEIQDTGPGLRPEDLERVFDPFFTTKPPGVGTGLGLSISKRIVDLHSGAISLRNVPGGGAIASVALKT